MIEITLRKNGFKVRGHANYAEQGKDIVCAGISSVIESAFIVLEDYLIDENTIQYRDSGVSEFWVVSELEEKQKTMLDTVLAMITITAKSLEHQYQEYVIFYDEYEL